MIKFFNHKPENKGQVMLLSIVIIGTSIMVVTIIAGYLMVQRLRFSSNMADSAKALFAADAGIECEQYNIFHPGSVFNCNDPAVLNFDDPLVSAQTINNMVNFYIKSTGTSNKSKRAFYLSY